MLVEILLDKTWVKYKYPQDVIDEEPIYPYLEKVEPITESTTAESGNAVVKLGVKAFTLLQFPLGKQCRIRDGLEVLFDGVISDITIDTSITFQLEA